MPTFFYPVNAQLRLFCHKGDADWISGAHTDLIERRIPVTLADVPDSV